jgi:uncharacterized protein YuzE
MVKVIGKPKNFGDMHGAWRMLLEKVGPDGDDFMICSIMPRKEIKYFHAKVDGGYIVINRAKEHVETAKINGERRIDFNQFGCVVQLYNEYVRGSNAIRPMMRDNCGQNTSYIISLIHYIL